MEGFKSEVIDDQLLDGPLNDLGWSVEKIPWSRTGEDWARFDAVVIRTTWDYQNDPDAFLTALESIQRSGARLENSLELVRWNLAKTYLRDLADRGIAVVPTEWGTDPTLEQALRWTESYGSWVIKPVVSASAIDTFKLSTMTPRAGLLAALGRFAGRDFMVQPFLEEIAEEGEYSLFFFGGELSHTVLKSPERGDFRVQEEFGGRVRAVQPEPLLLERATEVLAVLDPEPGLQQKPLYARIDMVRSAEDYLVMEVELIEPSFYLRYDPEAAQRFATALDQRCRVGESLA